MQRLFRTKRQLKTNFRVVCFGTKIRFFVTFVLDLRKSRKTKKMKKLGIILLMLVTVAASAQKVTRKDLIKLSKGDDSEILKDGFTKSSEGMYMRYDTTEVISVKDGHVLFLADNVGHNYSGNVSRSPKGDLVHDIFGTKKHKGYIDSDGEHTVEVSDLGSYIMETRTFLRGDGSSYFEFQLYRK